MNCPRWTLARASATPRGSIRTPASISSVRPTTLMVAVADGIFHRDRGQSVPCLYPLGGGSAVSARTGFLTPAAGPFFTDISRGSSRLTAQRSSSGSRSALKGIPVVPRAITFTSRSSRWAPGRPVSGPTGRLSGSARPYGAPLLGFGTSVILSATDDPPLPYAGRCLAARGFSGRGAPNEL